MRNHHSYYTALLFLVVGCASDPDPMDDPSSHDAALDQLSTIDTTRNDAIGPDGSTTDAGASVGVDVDAAAQADVLPNGDAHTEFGDAADALTDRDPQCDMLPVFFPIDTGFTVHETGGLPILSTDAAVPQPDGGPCTTRDLTTSYDFAARTLHIHGCRSDGTRMDDLFLVSDAEIAIMRARVETLRTSCTRACWVDGIQVDLAVRGAAGAVRRYRNSLMAGCPSDVTLPGYENWEFGGAGHQGFPALIAPCSVEPTKGDAGADGDAGSSLPADSGEAAPPYSDVAIVVVTSPSMTCPPRQRLSLDAAAAD